MADDADRSDERIAAEVANGIAAARRSPSLVPCGACHYCGSTVQASHLFCDADCRSDFDYMQDRRRANCK